MRFPKCFLTLLACCTWLVWQQEGVAQQVSPYAGYAPGGAAGAWQQGSVAQQFTPYAVPAPAGAAGAWQQGSVAQQVAPPASGLQSHGPVIYSNPPSFFGDFPSMAGPEPNGLVFWARAEYLLWWISRGPLPIPLVTINSDPATIAALSDPGTQVLLGRGSDTDRFNYGTIPGLRATLGGFLNQDCTLGLEGSGFLLQHRSVDYSFASAGGTSAVVSIPAISVVPFNGNPPGETSLNAGGGPNQIGVSSDTRLRGADANVLLRLLSNDAVRLDVLAGFRYLALDEDLTITDNFPDAGTGGNFTVRDSFSTSNQFYGGQLGARIASGCRGFTVDGTAKLGLGATHGVVDVQGLTTITNGAFGIASGAYPGGYLALTSNSGRRHNEQWGDGRNIPSMVSELQGRIGYDLTRNININAGYTFLYVTGWVRPGNQIDRNINPTQQPLLGGTGGELVGAAKPEPLFNRTDFWAQGVNFGLQVQW